MKMKGLERYEKMPYPFDILALSGLGFFMLFLGVFSWPMTFFVIARISPTAREAARDGK